ncbi:zinc finger, PMZ-type containing protein [Tanacetum coccineum]|uniref:Zinc finger, PMZ-type containing protein n=1 Tax=Tanacetum coccineum TaxID=301880 RepID=A0ABQ4WV82_9ASTR
MLMKSQVVKPTLKGSMSASNVSFNILQGLQTSDCVDGYFLKGTIKGELLIAMGRDINNQMFPIACAVVTVENKDNRGLTDIITLSVRKELENLKDYLRLWEVFPSSYKEFEIRKLNEGYGVNLETHKCTCRRWDLTGIPCIHAVAAYAFFMKDPADCVSECYSKRAWQNGYSSFILPVGGQSMWVKSGLPPSMHPKQRTMPGRPKGKISYKCILGQMEQPVHMKEPVRESNVQEHVNEDEDPGQNV